MDDFRTFLFLPNASESIFQHLCDFSPAILPLAYADRPEGSNAMEHFIASLLEDFEHGKGGDLDDDIPF